MRNPLSRRDFLHTGVAAAGGLLAAESVLLSPQSAEASTLRVQASDRVRFGIVGVGMQGSGLLATALALGHECVAAADLYDGRHTLAKEIAGNSNLPTTRRYQDLLDRSDIDCVIVATPDHQHRQIVVDAVRAGKDVYCEKPMSHTVSDGMQMVAAARRYNRIVQVGSQRVSSALCAAANRLYRDGVIGDVSMVELSLGRNTPTGAWQYPPPFDLSPQTLDWNAWLGSAPKIPFNPLHFARWRCWKEYGTGVAGDLMVHLISGMLYTLGWNEPPRSAQSLGGIVRWKDGRNMPDLHAVLFDYHGVPVFVRLGLGTQTPEVARFMGPKGILEATGRTLAHSPQVGEDTSPSYYAYGFPSQMREEYFEQWHAAHDPEPGKEPVDGVTTYHGPHWDDDTAHMWGFFDAVKTRKPVVQDAVFGNHAAIACHMANESFFRQAPVRWDEASGSVKS
ncbi:MAG: Gfo/Idh/MocA family oxidoreductase [Gemmatimonadota bacterium]|nr:Gfo/Idh/MocA family oxidoreductase [Gemmatimonadota bacterium]